MKILLAQLFIIVAGMPARADLQPEPTCHDISYGPHERHKLDVWLAKSGNPAPLLIFIHGGGWHGGEKTALPQKLLAFMIDHGVSVASINYRYTSMAILPGPVHDAARAVQFLRSRAGAWNLDAQHFGAYGVSAGGCSALWLAYHDDLMDPHSTDPVLRQSSRLQAALGISPQTSIDPEVIVPWAGDQVMNHAMIVRAVGAKDRAEVTARYAEWSALLREFSPINHVTHDDPPVMVAYPALGELPAASAGAAIHHAIFGVKLKEKADAVAAMCLLRLEDKKPTALPKPEEFLLQCLKPKP